MTVLNASQTPELVPAPEPATQKLQAPVLSSSSSRSSPQGDNLTLASPLRICSSSLSLPSPSLTLQTSPNTPNSNVTQPEFSPRLHRCRRSRRNRSACLPLVALYASFFFILFSLVIAPTATTTYAAVVPTTPSKVPNPFTNSNGAQTPFLHTKSPPPVDFAALGQVALLGDFDALTPVVTIGQQNTFESNTFSILELCKVPSPASANGNQSDEDRVLSVPVLLASFTLDAPLSSPVGSSPTAAESLTNYGITATCVLSSAPHQVYIGGYFTQVSSASSSSINSSSSSIATPTTSNPRTGLNYIGLYDSKLKRFLSMGDGVDGPVQSLLCDSSKDQVYVVGRFRAPLQDIMASAEGSSNNSSYQALGSFGGGVAVWKRALQDSGSEPSNSSSDDNEQKFRAISQASGSWMPLPFKGVNGVVASVAQTQDGTFYFGGKFDTTADGERFSAPDTQLVNMDRVMVTTGNSADAAQDKSIICRPSTGTRSNWIMRDNIPGHWRAEFPLHITPTLFRLWNIDSTEDAIPLDRGTETFSIVAQPSNQLLNLSYVDPITHIVQHCTVCILYPRPTSTSIHQGYQDFLVIKPVLLHAVQINILSWYGQGGGLGGIEVYQSEIFVRAVDELNTASKCTSGFASSSSSRSLPMNLTARTNSRRDSKDMTAYSSFLGADWVTMDITGGWQTVLATRISTSDQTVRSKAYVDLSPYLEESGMYDVYLYTPGCSAGSTGNSSTAPSNACESRGSVDVSMYFASPENAMTITLSQENTADKYDKIYSGMIVHSTSDFRPHVVIKPTTTWTGASGAQDSQTIIVDSIQFVKQATCNSTNSLLFYRPGSISEALTGVKAGKDQVKGLDSSTWGNLPTQLPPGAVVNSLITYTGAVGSSQSSSSSMLFVGGAFQGTEYANVVAWDGSVFVPLGQGKDLPSGVDGTVTGMAIYQSNLYVVGAFQQAYGSGAGATSCGGLGVYDIQTRSWALFGNATQYFQSDAQFRSIELSSSASGQPQLVIGGKFTWAQGLQTVAVATWDISLQKWIREDAQSNYNGQGPSAFQLGYAYGQISYLIRVLGSRANGTAENPVVLVAGVIESLDTYQIRQPENMAWLTASGRLKTVNLSPALSMSPAGVFYGANSNSSDNAIKAATQQIAQAPLLSKVGAGIIYLNKTSQQWITIVGGVHADGNIGAGYFYTPVIPSLTENDLLSYVKLDLTQTQPSSSITGEILALGINKDDSTGYGSTDAGGDLLLIGGLFKSSTRGVNGLALYDISISQVVSSSIMPSLRGVQGRDPMVQVIKRHPGDSKGVLILAGDFSGVGSGVACELICVWSPAAAREALDKENPLDSSFKSIYGDADSKNRLEVLSGVVNDIAFEDDRNMYVAGDLAVNGVACGVASFNFDTFKWTTFGSMINATGDYGAAAHPPEPDALTGPVTAITHDSRFHQFFVAGRSAIDNSTYFRKWNGSRFLRVSSEFMPSSEVHRLEILPALSNAPARTAASENDSNDTISILEQGYIILVSGRILLGSPSGSAMSFSGADHQELSLAFFDGQTWFPFIQSSQNGTSSTIAGPKAGSFGPTTPVGTFLDPGNNILLNPHPFDSGLVKRATLGDAASVQMRLRDQGVFRALAIAHLPRIVAQDYLPLKYIILIAVGISLGLIFFIILGAFLYVWLKGRLSKGGPTKRPKLGSSFMEDGYAGHGIRNVGTDPLGLRQGTTFASDADFKSEKVGSLFKSKKNGLGNSSANLASLSISCAAIESANNSYRPNSTIAETTDALVTEFVRNHQQQLAGEPSASSEQQQQEEKSGPVAPPSPDRRSKRPLKCKPQNQNSSSSDLTNPVAQAGRFPTLLAVGYNPSTPNSNAPTSPVTTMSTPRDITGASTAAVGAEASNMNDTNNPAAAAAVPGGVFYYAKYPFRAREIGELGFQAGARILVVDMSDDIWWMGVVQNANGQQMHGVFPSNYVGPTP